MTLHLSQIFLTDALTFITPHVATDAFVRPAGQSPAANLFVAVHNPPAIQIVRRKFDRDLVSRQYPDKVLPHLAGNMRQHLVFVFELHLEHGIRQRFDDRCHHFNRVLFTHYPPEISLTRDPSLARDFGSGLPLRSRPLDASTSIASSLLIDSLESVPS